MNGVIQGAADVLALVLLFGFTILLHELGHFWLALRLGFVVDTLSIGFGPALWKKKIRGITYKIGIIPVGGYVALPQIDPAGMAAFQGKSDADTSAPEGKAAGWWRALFGGRSSDAATNGQPLRELPPIEPWKKIVVSVSGAAGNCLLAVGLAWIVYLAPEGASIGVPEEGAIIGHVETNSVAYAAGLRLGDEIRSVNGKRVRNWYEFSVECLLTSGGSNVVALTALTAEGTEKHITVPTVPNERGLRAVEGVYKATPCIMGRVAAGSSAEAAGIKPGDWVREFDGVRVMGWEHFRSLVEKSGGRTVPIVVERKGKKIALTVTPRYEEKFGRPMIGVELGGVAAMPWMQHRRPLDQLKGDAMAIVRILQALVTPREAKRAASGLGGPVMIIAALWASIQISILNALGFLRFLNVNLAILNLLPFPVLDGGHVMFALWESVTRRPPSPRMVNAIVNVFATLLIAGFLLITYRDIVRLLDWSRGPEQAAERTSSASTNGATYSTNSISGER